MWRFHLIVFLFCACAGNGFGYAVGQAQSLEVMASHADLIVKAVATSTTIMAGSNLDSLGRFNPDASGVISNYKAYGFDVEATELRVISCLKGETTGPVIQFVHYGMGHGAMMYEPQHYSFIPGRAYVVFAKQGSIPGMWTQLWKNHTEMDDQGVMLAADDAPVAQGDIKSVMRNELLKLLRSTRPGDSAYATRYLDEMIRLTRDFSQGEVTTVTLH